MTDPKQIETELREMFPQLLELDFSFTRCGVRWRRGTSLETRIEFAQGLREIWHLPPVDDGDCYAFNRRVPNDRSSQQHQHAPSDGEDQPLRDVG